MPVTTLKYLGGLSTDQTNIDASSRNWYRVDDLDEQVRMLNEPTLEFYMLLQRIGMGAPKSQPKFGIVRSDVPKIKTRVNYSAGYNTTDTSLTVKDASVFTPGTVLQNESTGEQMKVTSLDSTTTITVTRGLLNSPAVAITDGDVLVGINPALGEKGTAHLTNGFLPSLAWNYMSFWAVKAQVTDLQQNTDMRFGINFSADLQKVYFQEKMRINYALMYSRRGYEDTVDEGRKYYTGGFEQQVQTNVFDLSTADGVLAWPYFNWIGQRVAAANTSSNSKVLLCGRNLYSAIQTIAYNRIVPNDYGTALGPNTNIMSIRTDDGIVFDVVLDKHLFEGVKSGDGAIIDSNFIEMNKMRGFEDQVRPEIQANDAHTREDEIFGSFSLSVYNEENHGIIRNCKGAY